MISAGPPMPMPTSSVGSGIPFGCQFPSANQLFVSSTGAKILLGGVVGVVWARLLTAPRAITTTIVHLSHSTENPLEHRRVASPRPLDGRLRVILERLLQRDSRSGESEKLFSPGA